MFDYLDPNIIPGWMSARQLGTLREWVLETEGPAPVVEIGCFQGRSSVVLGQAAKETGRQLLCIDSWDNWRAGRLEWTGKTWKAKPGRVKTNGDSIIRAFGRHMVNADLKSDVDYIVFRQKSTEAAKEIPKASFVMVDGDHSFEGVMADLENWIPKIESGTLCGDDYFHPKFAGVREAWNQFAKENKLTLDFSSKLVRFMV